MESIIHDIFAYDFLRNALIACILSGITCGIVGSYVVARRMVFLCGGITHASFGGLGIALYAGANPVIGALSFAALSSLGIEFASRRGRMREDSATGFSSSVGMATGALFMSLRPGYATDLTSYLFGNILLVDSNDIIYLSWLTLFIVVGAIVWLRKLMYIIFDEEYARSRGVWAVASSYVMAIVIAITIVLSIKVMGIILLLALLTMPAVISNTFTKDYRYIAFWSAVIGVVATIAGFVFSYIYDLPTGSCIIFILTGALICVKVLTLYRKTIVNR